VKQVSLFLVKIMPCVHISNTHCTLGTMIGKINLQGPEANQTQNGKPIKPGVQLPSDNRE